MWQIKKHPERVNSLVYSCLSTLSLYTSGTILWVYCECLKLKSVLCNTMFLQEIQAQSSFQRKTLLSRKKSSLRLTISRKEMAKSTTLISLKFIQNTLQRTCPAGCFFEALHHRNNSYFVYLYTSELLFTYFLDVTHVTEEFRVRLLVRNIAPPTYLHMYKYRNDIFVWSPIGRPYNNNICTIWKRGGGGDSRETSKEHVFSWNFFTVFSKFWSP